MARSRSRSRDNWGAQSERLRRKPETWSSKHSKASRKDNQPEENLTPRDPLHRARPAGNRRLWEIPYLVLLADSPKSLRTTNSPGSVTSSRRRARPTAHRMHTHLYGRRQQFQLATSTRFHRSIHRFHFLVPRLVKSKSQDGGVGFTDFTDFPTLFRGCTCEARSRARSRSPARTSRSLPPDRSGEIGEIGETPHAVRRLPFHRTGGTPVKSAVKSPGGRDE